MDTLHFPNPASFVAVEIWSKIFENLQNSETSFENSSRNLYSCYQTCTKFRDILEESKLVWLFYQVVSDVASYITATDLLNCRLVCKSWTTAVDHCLKITDDLCEITNSNLRTIKGKTVFSTFYTSAHITQFLLEFNDFSKNPFPGRRVSLACNRRATQEQYNQFWSEHIMLLLGCFGSHIRTLCIQLRVNAQINQFLKLCLGLVPNLRYIYIQGDNRYGETDNFLFDLMMPKLKTLNRLVFTVGHSSNTIPSIIQLHLCSVYRLTLKQVKISLVNFTSKCFPLMLIHMPNLEDLHVSLKYSFQLRFLFPEDCYTYKNLRQVTIRLVRVDPRTIGFYKSCHVFQLRDLLIPLSRSSCTLRKLTIQVRVQAEKFLALVNKHDAQHLQAFLGLQYLCIEGFQFNRTQLLPYLPKSLQKLQLNNSADFGWGRILGVSGDLHNLDLPEIRTILWDGLPKLRQITVFDTGCESTYLKESDVGPKCKPWIAKISARSNTQLIRHEIFYIEPDISLHYCEGSNQCNIWSALLICMFVLMVGTAVVPILLYFLSKYLEPA